MTKNKVATDKKRKKKLNQEQFEPPKKEAWTSSEHGGNGDLGAAVVTILGISKNCLQLSHRRKKHVNLVRTHPDRYLHEHLMGIKEPLR